MEKVDIRNLKMAQPDWFSRGNKRFFNDVAYRVLRGKETGNIYLVRSTYGWTDMFGGKRKLHWRINAVDPVTLRIGELVNETFADIWEVRKWLKTR